MLIEWLNEIEQNISRENVDGPFSDLGEKKTMLDKFKFFLTDVLQHSDMVSSKCFQLLPASHSCFEFCDIVE